jgi:hypothetical protein
MTTARRLPPFEHSKDPNAYRKIARATASAECVSALGIERLRSNAPSGSEAAGNGGGLDSRLRDVLTAGRSLHDRYYGRAPPSVLRVVLTRQVKNVTLKALDDAYVNLVHRICE